MVNNHRYDYCNDFLAGSGDRRGLWRWTEAQISSACECVPESTAKPVGSSSATLSGVPALATGNSPMS